MDFVAARVGGLVLVLAWAYVALRVIHTLIHLTYNNVLHRLTAFAASNGVLGTLWVVFFLTSLRHWRKAEGTILKPRGLSALSRRLRSRIGSPSEMAAGEGIEPSTFRLARFSGPFEHLAHHPPRRGCSRPRYSREDERPVVARARSMCGQIDGPAIGLKSASLVLLHGAIS